MTATRRTGLQVGCDWARWGPACEEVRTYQYHRDEGAIACISAYQACSFLCFAEKYSGRRSMEDSEGWSPGQAVNVQRHPQHAALPRNLQVEFKGAHMK